MPIKILNKYTAAKISAGEVVERPASVVKELVENSLDAGSKKIQVHVESGGLKSIKVIDDGMGIRKNEIKTAFERFATSKIDDDSDLTDVRTMGFRGEAQEWYGPFLHMGARCYRIEPVKVFEDFKSMVLGGSVRPLF